MVMFNAFDLRTNLSGCLSVGLANTLFFFFNLPAA